MSWRMRESIKRYSVVQTQNVSIDSFKMSVPYKLMSKLKTILIKIFMSKSRGSEKFDSLEQMWSWWIKEVWGIRPCDQIMKSLGWWTKDFSFHIATLKKLGDFSGGLNKTRTVFETYLTLGNSESKSGRPVRRQSSFLIQRSLLVNVHVFSSVSFPLAEAKVWRGDELSCCPS